MNKLKLCILTLAIGAMCFTSCKKEENSTSNGIHFTATISTDAKTILNGVNINWVNDDQIKIFGTNTTGWIYTATPQSGNSTWADFAPANGGDAGTPIDNVFTAIYPADAVVNSTTFTIPDEQSYATDQIVDFPMYGKSTSNDPYKLVFKNLCGALKIRLKGNTTVTGIKVTTNTYINGDYTISSDGNSIEMTEGTTNHTNSTTLSCNQQLSSTQYHDFYVFLPAGNYTYVEIKIFSNDGKTCTQKLGDGNTLNVTRSKYTLISFNNPTFVTPPTCPTGALSGLFTYDNQGHQLRFSHGILALQKFNTTPVTTGDYYMVSEQYKDRDNGDVRYDYCTFQWSKGSTDVPTISNADNNVNWHAIGHEEIRFIAFNNYRKAYFNSIGKPHWHSYAMVQVEGVPGILLLPDYFFWPKDDIPQPRVFDGTPGSTGNGVNYTGDDWRTLEEAGCVFMKGEQSSNGIRYWTNTEYSSNTTKAYFYSIFGYSVPGLGSSSNYMDKTNSSRIRYVLYEN